MTQNIDKMYLVYLDGEYANDLTMIYFLESFKQNIIGDVTSGLQSKDFFENKVGVMRQWNKFT